MPLREPRCTVKNRVRELRSPGTVRDEGSNVLVYSEKLDSARPELVTRLLAGYGIIAA
jgi:hypothetical protein